MPTIQQLPKAAAVNATDTVMLDQDGASVAATVAQVLTATGATITLTGDVTGSGVDTIITTLAPVVTPGAYSKVSVNAKGQVTAGGAVAAADVIGALGYTPYSAANPAGYAPASALGSMAGQDAGAVAITGGTLSGAELGGAALTAAGSNTARTLAARAAERIDVLDFGADPTGVADSAPAFAAAMASVPSGAWGRVVAPRGTYRLGSFLNQPAGRSIGFVFEDGANISGGGLGVDRIESTQGPYSLWQGGGGWFGFAPTVGSPLNLAFHNDFVQNGPGNSASSRVAWSRNYSNNNYYGKYVTGIDIAEQSIFSWSHLYDNSSGWGHWEVINGAIYDEDSAARAHVTASGEHSEFDVVNNGPEAGWTWKSGIGNAVQGMSMDPWGQNGLYGGNLLYAYGSVGSYDGQNGGLNQRWVSYPAVFSAGNPPAVPTGSTIVITFDVTAKAAATLSGGAVSAVAVSNGGGAYASAPSVVFSGGGGSGAAGTAVMLGGAVVGVTVTNPGSGYTSAPAISFAGGGVAAPVATTVALNADGAHGDLAAVAAAINAAGIPLVRASVARWGGVVSRLVICGVAPQDLGTLTLGGSALAALGIAAGATSTRRDVTAVAFGGTGGCLPTDQLIVNGTTITVGGAGAQADAIAAINRANLVGIKADSTGSGRLVISCFLPQNPGGLVLGQPAGFTTLGKLGLSSGTFYAPVPPKGFATAMGDLTSPICNPADRISIAATDMAGNSYGPVTVTLNGGGGTGWPADVAASINAAVTAAGFGATTLNTLTAPPAVVLAVAKGSGGAQGVFIRNTAGGALTLANVSGTPLQTLGLTPGTYQPGGYSAASQSVFMAAQDSIAAGGRGIFLGGASNPTDRTTWPNAPLEARGGFLRGLRTDQATFDDGVAVQMAASQALAFGSGAGALKLANDAGTLTANGVAVALASAVPTHVSQLANDAGYIVGSVGANLTLAGGTLSATGAVSSFNGRDGAVGLTGADVTAALGYAPLAAAVGSVAAGAGLTGGTITGAGTISLAAIAAGSLMGNAGGAAAAPGAIALGANLTLAAGTLSAAGAVASFNGRAGAVSLSGADVTGALGYTPVSNSGGTLSGSMVNAGTIAGGTLSPATLIAGAAASMATVSVANDVGGYHPVQVKASGTNANVPLVLAPAGSGYLAAALSDGAAAGGAQRGQYATDWQQSRSAAAQVASGAYAAIPGGSGNTASGSYSLAAGQQTSASGQGGVALGQYSSDGGAYGKLVFSANAAAVGNQFAVSTLYVSSVNSATRMTSDGGAAGAANSLPIRSNHVIAGTLTVAARNVSNGDGACWSIPVLFRNSAGTVSVTSPASSGIAPTAADASLAAASIAIAADNTNKGLSVTITPPASTTINASAVFLAAEM